MCKGCLIELARTLTVEAQTIFNILAENKRLNKTKIQELSGFSYAITEKKLLELNYKQLVKKGQKGRSTLYWLSEEGGLLSKLLNQN